MDVIGFLQARPHNIGIDSGAGVIYLTDPPTPMMAGGIFGGAAQAAAGTGQGDTAAGSVDRTQERVRGGLVKQVIPKK
jgi:hypothetical protein